MKFKFFFFAMLIISCIGNAQTKTEQYIQESIKAQEALNAEYANPEETPLLPEDLAEFKGLEFFPINPELIFEVSIKRTPQAIPFMMKRTKDEVKYQKYGEITFEYIGEKYKLSVYQNLDLIAKRPEYSNHLFLPFTDLTNGETTYGGGRYLDLEIPEKGAILVLNFNKAYNPLCACNKKYSCPIPPAENDLGFKVEAGVKNWKH
ncbi:MAG: DUF1684 domain-containing protein [Bacteroidales bacterium]|nr:DUF1684 domain-containing protein [Bacteroidales bacterium]